MEKTTKQKADELIELFYQKSPDIFGTGKAMSFAIKCAIIAQERVVNELEIIWEKSSRLSNNFWVIENQIVSARELLIELKSRL